MGVPLYVTCFSLVAFNILSLSLIFVSLITTCPGYVPPWVYPAWDSLWFLDLVDYFLSHVWEFFNSYLFKYFLRSFLSLSSPSGAPIMQMLVHLMLSQRSLRLSSFLFILFSIFYSVPVISTILSSRSFIHSDSVILLLVFSIFASIFFSRDPESSSLSLFWILFLEGCQYLLHLAVCLGFHLVPSSGT